LRLWQLVVIGVLALALVALGIIAYPHSNPSSTSSTAKVGEQVPTFSLPNLTSSGHVGVPETTGTGTRPAVLIFFASWCHPCQQEMPALSKAINDGGAGDATVLGIDALNPVTSAAKSFVAKNDMTFPIGVDTDGTVTNGSFGFLGLPYVVFVNAQGVITEIHPGALSPAELHAGVKAAS
jgi:peroxiredoxin